MNRKSALLLRCHFRDRVAQHALCNVIGPILERRFIYHSYACRKLAKVPIGGADQIQTWLRECERGLGSRYCLEKFDVAKYFARIDHRILLANTGASNKR